MFCPQCRHSWPSRSDQINDAPPAKRWSLPRLWKAKPGLSPCPVCHGPLVPDRLEQEFPPVAHASKSEPSLSMVDILREIGPITASPGSGGPHDRANASGHADESTGFVPLRPRRRVKIAPLDTLLGFSALAVTAGMMVMLGIGMLWNQARTAAPQATMETTDALPPARSGGNPGTGSVTDWSASAILASLPASVPGGWRRWEADSDLTGRDTLAAAGQRMATYQRGTQTVHVWLLKTPESADALTAFGGADRFVHTPQALLRQSPAPTHLYGHDCLSFVDAVPPTISHSIEASHPFAVAGFTLTWYRQGTLTTIAADDLKTRDDFASAYAPQH